MHLLMNMAQASTLAAVVMAAMVATMMNVRSSKHALDLLAVVMDLMVVSRAMDFHAMDLDSQQMVHPVMMAIHRRIGQPTNSIVIGLEQGHVQRVYCVPL